MFTTVVGWNHNYSFREQKTSSFGSTPKVAKSFLTTNSYDTTLRPKDAETPKINPTNCWLQGLTGRFLKGGAVSKGKSSFQEFSTIPLRFPNKPPFAWTPPHAAPQKKSAALLVLLHPKVFDHQSPKIRCSQICHK